MDRFAANDRKVKAKKTLHIPNDIFFSILSKLPIKSFKRFECVCKSWSLLFDDSYFMTIYRNYFLTKDHSYYDDTSILLQQIFSNGEESSYFDTHELFYGASGKRFDNRVKLDWPSVKNLDVIALSLDKNVYSRFAILGSSSVHGILCLTCTLRHNIVLWNPSSKEFKVIPPNPFDSGPYWTTSYYYQSFGYDHVRDDYKLIRHLNFRPKANYNLNVLLEEDRHGIWEIYSLRSNAWRKFDYNMLRDDPMCREHLYIDGFSHWMLTNRSNEGYLMSFDWSNETFITTPIPTYMNDDVDYMSVFIHLVLLNGSIALILKYTKTSTFHISILGELGVKESWIKLFIVGPLPCLDYPIGAGKKGDILFENKDGWLIWFDLNTQMMVDGGIPSQGFNRNEIVVHKENLLSFEGKNI